MSRLIEFRFNYPLIEREQPLMPGFDPALVDPKVRTAKVVSEYSVGHIEVRKGKYSKHGIEWDAWQTECGAKCEGQRKTSAKALAARATCTACLTLYKNHPDYPDNRLLKVWEQGGTKVFER